MSLKIRFHGAAREVTGSCTQVTCGPESILIDCGMFQGRKETWEKNYEPFGFDASTISHVILTHAHADHSGRLPLLVKKGYAGAIHAHHATVDLAEIILLDSAHIHETEAGWRTKKNVRRGDPKVTPLYTTPDAEATLPHFARVNYHTPVRLSERFSFTLLDAGHILGSSIVLLDVTLENGDSRRIVFSGDLGRLGQPLIHDPHTVAWGDYLVVESTYGDRRHKDIASTKDELAAILQEASAENGNVIIPSFAVGRSQEIAYYFRELYEEGRVPHPYETIHLDSPMAVRATEVYDKAARECYDDETLARMGISGHAVLFPHLRFVETVDESILLNMTTEGQVVLSASGMCDAGRVLHHLRHNLGNPKSHIVIVGYQAEGTKGRKIVEGQKVIKIMGEPIEVKAHIHTVNALSAHADGEETINWASTITPAPRLTMVVHGEPEQAEGLKRKLTERLGFKSTIPTAGEEIFLD
ncbi:MAG: MBL fold metallo-hydrolase [Nitrospinae bacterium]|nr:MBL fold metallo-hydrolase [Nitrospinota bacterium]